MKILILICTILTINLIVLIINIIKTQDKYNEMIISYICDILDIIKYNGLVRPIEEAKDEQIQK